ncbi:MAG: T9SS type A sorting domain-containing protein, partial [Bacteroidota bacterium]|nr:T9SS type A sorting domain-containing protein [Bacteroidota bacterium]
SFTATAGEPVTITLLDIQGRTVSVKRTVAIGTGQEVSISTKDLASGSYICRIEVNEESRDLTIVK